MTIRPQVEVLLQDAMKRDRCGSTHYEDCERVHRDCAIVKLAEWIVHIERKQAKSEKFNPRDVAILGGDPSL